MPVRLSAASTRWRSSCRSGISWTGSLRSSSSSVRICASAPRVSRRTSSAVAVTAEEASGSSVRASALMVAAKSAWVTESWRSRARRFRSCRATFSSSFSRSASSARRRAKASRTTGATACRACRCSVPYPRGLSATAIKPIVSGPRLRGTPRKHVSGGSPSGSAALPAPAPGSLVSSGSPVRSTRSYKACRSRSSGRRRCPLRASASPSRHPGSLRATPRSSPSAPISPMKPNSALGEQFGDLQAELAEPRFGRRGERCFEDARHSAEHEALQLTPRLFLLTPRDVPADADQRDRRAVRVAHDLAAVAEPRGTPRS